MNEAPGTRERKSALVPFGQFEHAALRKACHSGRQFRSMTFLPMVCLDRDYPLYLPRSSALSMAIR